MVIDEELDMKINRRDILKSGLGVLGSGLISLGKLRAESFLDEVRPSPILLDPQNPAIQLNMDRCERCGDCKAFCSGYQTVLDLNREDKFQCVYCGQCTLICPGQALTERYVYPEVMEHLDNTQKIKIASIAPSVRVSIGESFGLMPGRNIDSKLISALRETGFNYVLDTCFGADITVMTEAAELVERLKHGVSGPMFTSCCPAWKRFAELFYPKWVKNISKTKSPFLIQGALTKTWFARKMKLDPAKIIHVAIAPCTGKKYEITLPAAKSAVAWHGNGQYQDLDYSLTTRETTQLLKSRGISRLSSMENGKFDSFMGEASGAGLIFGNTGGVLEATLRTAYWMLNKKDPPEMLLKWDDIRGLRSIRTAEVDLGDRSISVAVVHGLAAIRAFLSDLEKSGRKFDFVEMMACPAGCIGGGGQPRSTSDYENLCKRRAAALYQLDEKDSIRLSYNNPDVQLVQKEFLNNDKNKQLLISE